MEIKQAIIIPADLAMSPGKLAAQAAHAAVGACEKASFKVLAQWKENGVTKIVLKVPTENDLGVLIFKANKAGLPWFLVADAGRTEIPANSITALAIGPGEIDSITGNLPLY